MKAILSVRWWCCAALFPFVSVAAELPELVLPAGVGVNIHFTRGHEPDLDLIAAAGFKFVRMDFVWAATERKRGEYDWGAYDELTAALEKRGLRAYYILDYSNPLYEGTAASKNPITGLVESHDVSSPQHPESVAAFARWAAAAARHFQNRHVVWEIWNEPNISFWKPKPDVAQYTSLALATCKAIREAAPGATLVAPAASGFPWEFLESFLKSGVLAYLDGVSVHPYRSSSTPPETASKDYARLRRLIETCAATEAGKQLPILSGEWGYSSNTKGVSLETQAKFLVRQQLANLRAGVPISIWYDWKNDGVDPRENEHNFGVVTHDLKPKPAYRWLQTLTRELAGYRILERYQTGNEADYVLVLRNGSGQTKLAAWTVGQSQTVTLNLEAAAVPVLSFIHGGGESGTLEIRQQQCAVELTDEPKYISLKEARLVPAIR